MVDEIKQSKIRPVSPRKLVPPPEVTSHLKEKRRERMMANPVLRFFILFFGEGL